MDLKNGFVVGASEFGTQRALVDQTAISAMSAQMAITAIPLGWRHTTYATESIMDTTETDMQSTTEDLTNKAKQCASDFAEHGRHWAERAGNCVRENPTTCLLAAVGIGALASFLLCRRS